MTAARIWTGKGETFVAQLKKRFSCGKPRVEKDETKDRCHDPHGARTPSLEASSKASMKPGPFSQETPAASDTPMYYRKGASMAAITFAGLTDSDPDRLGELWPRLGAGKYRIFSALCPAGQELIEKKLTMYAYEKADRDFLQGDSKTFEHFGKRLREIPSLAAMDEHERAKSLYRHYLNFTEQHGIACTPHPAAARTLLPSRNPVETLLKKRGGDAELSRTLQQMFLGGRVPCEMVDTWQATGQPLANERRRAISTGRGRDGSPGEIYDPSMYLAGTARDSALSWRAWINQVRINRIPQAFS